MPTKHAKKKDESLTGQFGKPVVSDSGVYLGEILPKEGKPQSKKTKH